MIRSIRKKAYQSLRIASNIGIGAALIASATVMPAQARSLADIMQSKELRICISPVHPAFASVEPAACRDNCKFTGAVYEQAMLFAKTLGTGVQPKLLRVDWDEQFFNKDGKTVKEASYTPELMASGRCDVYPTNLTKNEWRLKKLDFAVYFPNRMMVIASKAMKGKVKTAADLAGKTAAVEVNTSYHTWLLEQNQTTYSANPVKLALMNTQESFLAVESGKVDFTIGDADIALWSVRHQLKNASTAFPVGPSDEIGWAFRKDDKDLQLSVQKFFTSQLKNDESPANQIWKKNYGISLNTFIRMIGSTQ
jgi:membrane-bound lytic murein transglycosylase F